MNPTAEPVLSREGDATRQWLLDRLQTNASLDPYEGPFGDDRTFTPEQRVRLARYLAGYGEWFVPATLPEGVPGGSPYACFANTVDFVCLHAFWDHAGALRPYLPAGASASDGDYVEGICMNRKAPVLHAWAAWPGSQRVYDLTYGITAEGDDWEWETPSRFHHYAEAGEMAFVGVRVPREAVLGLIAISRLLDSGMPSTLGVDEVLPELEADPTEPGLAVLRGVRKLLLATTLTHARRKGIGPVRQCLKQIDAEIERREG